MFPAVLAPVTSDGFGGSGDGGLMGSSGWLVLTIWNVSMGFFFLLERG